jgi:hypothetical protein
MRKKSPTLACQLSTPLTTKTREHVVLAYNLPRGRGVVDRGKVAKAAQETAQAEAPHAALPARPCPAAALRDVRFYMDRIYLIFSAALWPTLIKY